ncbi:hypothetical protein AHAS_Ahas16G0241500 [Arachis hypogaea]
MTITLQDIAYQLGLNVDRDPISGYIGRWEQFYRDPVSCVSMAVPPALSCHELLSAEHK